MKILFYNLLLVVLTTSSSYARQGDKAEFSAKVDTSLFQKINIKVLNQNSFYANNELYRLMPDGDDFKFNLDGKPYPQRIIFQLEKNKKTVFSGQYYYEKGDDVRLIYSKDNVDAILKFEGPGANKYNLINRLLVERTKFRTWRSKMKINSTTDLQTILDTINIYEQRLKDVVDKTSDISNTMRRILKYEFVDYKSVLREYVFNGLESKRNSTDKKAMLRSFYASKLLSSDEIDPVVIYCPWYLVNTMTKLKVDQLVSMNSDKNTIQDVYEGIINTYSEKVRQMMLIEFFGSVFTLVNMQLFDSREYDSLVLDAKRFSEGNDVLKKLLRDKSQLKKGSLVFDPGFTDIKGDKFQLSTLKGKVIILKIWGKGCGGCIVEQHQFSKEIFPAISNNSKVAVVSLCFGKRESWIEGMKSGRYTSDNYINVYTEGITMDHPFINYYNIRGTPFSILIDEKGRIHSKLDLALAPRDILAHISSALNQVQ